MSKRALLLVTGLVVLVGGWALFRPELLFVKTNVNEALPVTPAATTAGPKTLASGNFHSVAHETRGTATVLELPESKRVVRFTGFETSNGPDVRVFLVAAADATDNDTVKKAGYIELGKLKGTTGDQNYDVPADADLAKYQAVTIWCDRFSVNFGTAPLQAQGMGPKALAMGSFHSVAHETKGTATVFELADGKRVVRVTGFETSNGPDVRVYLVAAPDATDNDTVKKAGFIELGKLKGTTGDQNYDLPADADLAKYQAVTIWCARFSVNFGTAPLTRQ